MTSNFNSVTCFKYILFILLLNCASPAHADSVVVKVGNSENFVETFYSENGYNWNSPGISAAKLGTGGTIRLVQSLWWGQMYESARQAGLNTSSLTIPKVILGSYGDWFKMYLDKYQHSTSTKPSTTDLLRLSRIAADLSDAEVCFPPLRPIMTLPLFNEYFTLFGSTDSETHWLRFEKSIRSQLQNNKPADIVALYLLMNVPSEHVKRSADLLLSFDLITDGEAAFVYEYAIEVLKFRRILNRDK